MMSCDRIPTQAYSLIIYPQMLKKKKKAKFKMSEIDIYAECSDINIFPKVEGKCCFKLWFKTHRQQLLPHYQSQSVDVQGSNRYFLGFSLRSKKRASCVETTSVRLSPSLSH